MMKFILLISALISAQAFAGLPPTTSKGSGDSTNLTTFNFQFPNFQITHTGITAAIGPFIPRRITATSTSTLTIDSSITDIYTLTAQAASLTIAAPTYSVLAPTTGQSLLIRIKDAGSPEPIAFNVGANGFRAIGVLLPSTTISNMTLYIAAVWNNSDGYWDVVGINSQ